ncbi:hypothetical protein B0H19DRAFT_1067394 [Mycena capillaripes]|nr:hypothetical protein B0H19DRAFT_1086236 [Mycena capillaripes]KAJ6563775.1 hypothetical protein B0H19DRAFT_1067394 [Mycena capillaripes]
MPEDVGTFFRYEFRWVWLSSLRAPIHQQEHYWCNRSVPYMVQSGGFYSKVAREPKRSPEEKAVYGGEWRTYYCTVRGLRRNLVQTISNGLKINSLPPTFATVTVTFGHVASLPATGRCHGSLAVVSLQAGTLRLVLRNTAHTLNVPTAHQQQPRNIVANCGTFVNTLPKCGIPRQLPNLSSSASNSLDLRM